MTEFCSSQFGRARVYLIDKLLIYFVKAQYLSDRLDFCRPFQVQGRHAGFLDRCPDRDNSMAADHDCYAVTQGLGQVLPLGIVQDEDRVGKYRHTAGELFRLQVYCSNFLIGHAERDAHRRMSMSNSFNVGPSLENFCIDHRFVRDDADS